MIKGELLGGDELKAKFSQAAPKFTAALGQSIGRLVLMLQRNVKADKLSGQVLRVRTGRLRRSINARTEGIGTETPAGYVGTNVSYARAHEYGFAGRVTVKQHMRNIKQAFGRSITPVQVMVGTHTRRVDIPEKSFLRSALSELEPQIKSEIRGAVTEALK